MAKLGKYYPNTWIIWAWDAMAGTRNFLLGFLTLREVCGCLSPNFPFSVSIFFHMKNELSSTCYQKNKVIKVQLLNLSHSITNLLGVFVHTLHCLHGFWIHLSMFWEQTNQVFLGIGHMVQICFCLFLGSGASTRKPYDFFATAWNSNFSLFLLPSGAP